MLIGLDGSRATIARRTGTEAYAYFLIRALIPLVEARGHRLRLYFRDAPHARLFPASPVVETAVIPFPRFWTHLRLGREVRRRPPDVFYTPAHVIPFGYRGAAVATIHDLGYRHFPRTHPWRQLAYLRWSTRHNGRVSRRVIVDSKATRQDLVRFEHISPDKIDVVYPGINPNLKPVIDMIQIEETCRRYGIRRPYFLCLGTLQPRKNLVRLVRSFSASQLAARHQLVLAGRRGWLAKPLEAAIATLPDRDARQILLPGFIADEDKAAVLSGATGLLFPSLYEGFGFPLLEAQACDTAVLAASASSLPELAADSALLVDPFDEQALSAGMIRLAQDETFRRTLIQRGRANVKRFSWQNTAEQVLETLERVAQAPA